MRSLAISITTQKKHVYRSIGNVYIKNNIRKNDWLWCIKKHKSYQMKNNICACNDLKI